MQSFDCVQFLPEDRHSGLCPDFCLGGLFHDLGQRLLQIPGLELLTQTQPPETKPRTVIHHTHKQLTVLPSSRVCFFGGELGFVSCHRWPFPDQTGCFPPAVWPGSRSDSSSPAGSARSGAASPYTNVAAGSVPGVPGGHDRKAGQLYPQSFRSFTRYVTTTLSFTFIHLANTFIQSDSQEWALEKVHGSMIINNKIAPKTLRVEMSHVFVHGTWLNMALSQSHL